MASKLKISDLFVYRWRYILGYGAIAALVVGMLFFAGAIVPGGLTDNEMISAVDSAKIDFSHIDTVDVINLPYHLVQLASINLFGVSSLSIKLASLIFGLLSALGLVLLLRRWYKYNIAILSAIIAFSTSQFMFISQNGTAHIMFVFWSVWLLLAATMIARQAKPVLFWRVGFFSLAALSLYTPLSIYILMAIVITVILHPHLRYLFRKVSKKQIVFAIVFGMIFLAPLIYKIILDPQIGLMMIGVPDTWTSFSDRALLLFNQYFDFTNNGSQNGMILPFFGLGSALIIVIGTIAMLRSRYSVKSYMITIWIMLLLPVLILNPDVTSITLVPIVLLLANGINYLLRKWYGLFPKNPYARALGLVPLVILVGSLVISGVGRYAYSYYYNPPLVNSFSKDISHISDILKDAKEPIIIVATQSDLDFYKVMIDRQKTNILLVNNIKQTNLKASTVIVAGEKKAEIPEGLKLDRIVTDGRTNNSDRFYIYKISTN